MAPNRRLKQARELRGWSQAKVAEQIGTDATTVSRWERGLFLPTPHFRERLCTLFASNAEELGLLEATRFSQQPTIETLEQPDSGSIHEQEKRAQEAILSQPSSLPANGDTFTYILQSASQEQQAYMLWEHAYVRALQDQRADAQQLGEASATVFEQAKHPKAALVRTWLRQQGLVPASPTSPNPSPQPERKNPPWSHLGGTGLFLLSLIIISCLISGLAFRWSTPSANSSIHSSQSREENEVTPLPTRPAQAIQSTLPPQPTPSPLPSKDNTHIAPTSVPILASPTAPPRPTPSPTTSPTSNITATISPSQLTPHTCNQDSSSYRCVLTLRLYAPTNTTFTWQVASMALPARFNLANGAIVAGQDIVVIAYIDTLSCSYGGKLTFKFGLPNTMPTLMIFVSWQC